MARTHDGQAAQIPMDGADGPLPKAPRKGGRRTSTPTPEATNWEAEARHILRAEMERRGVTLKELARRLESAGASETPKAIGMRINRGTFTFAFALRAFRALGVTKPDLSALPDRKADS